MRFHKVKVVSRNIITDWIQAIRNTLGLELKAYTNIIDHNIKELLKECPEKTKWHKIDIEETSGGAFIILIYGEKK